MDVDVAEGATGTKATINVLSEVVTGLNRSTSALHVFVDLDYRTVV